jgi:hypothetical protein
MSTQNNKKEVVILIEKDKPIAAEDVGNQLKNQGWEWKTDELAVVTAGIEATFKGQQALMQKLAPGAISNSALNAWTGAKIFAMTVPISYLAYLQDAKERNGDLGLQNHLEAMGQVILDLFVDFNKISVNTRLLLCYNAE